MILSVNKVPATLITGFLGAGKTTLIRHLLESNRHRNIAVIINEFGDIGIDRSLLLGQCCSVPYSEDNIVELADGCLCCTISDTFLPAMQALITRCTLPPDHIIIEMSGLALPKPLVQAFQWPDIRSRVTVDGVITIVDTLSVAAWGYSDQLMISTENDVNHPLLEVFSDQLACADMVLLGKSDLVTAETIEAVKSRLSKKLRPGVKFLSIRNGCVDSEVLLGLKRSVEDDLTDRHSIHDNSDEHDHDDFESFTLAIPITTDPDALKDRLITVVSSHNILRIKGFLNVPDKAMRLVMQGVGPRFQHYFDRPWRVTDSRCGYLMVVGMRGLDHAVIAATVDDSATIVSTEPSIFSDRLTL